MTEQNERSLSYFAKFAQQKEQYLAARKEFRRRIRESLANSPLGRFARKTGISPLYAILRRLGRRTPQAK